MPGDKIEDYRLSLLRDLLIHLGGIEDAEEVLESIVRYLSPIMDVEYTWLLTVEGERFKTCAHPAGQPMMGKETIAFLMSDEFRAVIPDLAAHRAARGAAYFPDDARSLVALAAQRGRHADGYLVIASRKPAAYSKENVDFLFMLMLCLRPLFKALRLQSECRRLRELSPALPPSPTEEEQRGGENSIEETRRMLTAMLVHDLRSPLGIIHWNMEQLLDGVSGSLGGEQERFVRASIESTQELLEMADSLLDIDRLESGALSLDLQDCSLPKLAKNITERMDFVTRQMGINFSFDFQAGYPDVRLDKQLIRRVLFNLIFNASKYAPEGSTIHIEGGFGGARVWLAVEDEGQGIPEEYLESIFDRYVQAPPDGRLSVKGGMPPAHANIRGKGLGLTFCRLVVTAHGGTIRAQNAPAREGASHGGARFVIEFTRESGSE